MDLDFECHGHRPLTTRTHSLVRRLAQSSFSRMAPGAGSGSTRECQHRGASLPLSGCEQHKGSCDERLGSSTVTPMLWLMAVWDLPHPVDWSPCLTHPLGTRGPPGKNPEWVGKGRVLLECGVSRVPGAGEGEVTCRWPVSLAAFASIPDKWAGGDQTLGGRETSDLG